MSGDDNLRIACYCLRGVMAKRLFDLIEIAQLPDRVQMRVWLVKQEQAMILAGDAHQAEHSEKLKLAFGELAKTYVAAGYSVLDIDAHVLYQIANVCGFSVTEESFSFADQRAK